MRVLGLAASPRRGGNSESLLDLALAEIPAAGGYETGKRWIRDYKVGPCEGHEDCRQRDRCVTEDDFPALAGELMTADACLFAIPVYFWGVPAQLKAFIDRHVYYYGVRKYAARAIGLIIVAADDGIEETEEQMRNFLITGGLSALPWSSIDILHAYAHAKGDAVGDPDLVQKAKLLGRRLAGRLAGDIS